MFLRKLQFTLHTAHQAVGVAGTPRPHTVTQAVGRRPCRGQHHTLSWWEGTPSPPPPPTPAYTTPAHSSCWRGSTTTSSPQPASGRPAATAASWLTPTPVTRRRRRRRRPATSVTATCPAPARTWQWGWAGTSHNTSTRSGMTRSLLSPLTKKPSRNIILKVPVFNTPNLFPVCQAEVWLEGTANSPGHEAKYLPSDKRFSFHFCPSLYIQTREKITINNQTIRSWYVRTMSLLNWH